MAEHTTLDYDHYGKDHATRHTSGDDDIQSATSSQKGLMTATHVQTLEAAATQADVIALAVALGG
jgi:hypothetical protein